MKQIRNVVSSTLIASVVSQKSLSFICHSGLDPESIVFESDSRFRRDFNGAINFTFELSFRFLLEPEIEFKIIKPGDRWFDPL